MQPPSFDSEFIEELAMILRSEGIAERYDPSSGKLISRSREPFTGEWNLDSLEIVNATLVLARFSAGGRQVTGIVDARDFKEFTGKRSRTFFPNASPYSDLAVYVSELIQEKILVCAPAEIEADEVRISH